MSNLAIRSFSAGELAPALYARTDQARYEVGLRRCHNFLTMRQGGVTKRPGTEFLTEVKDSALKVRLIPFVFNVRQSFVLEFGDEYVRFIQNGGIVEDPDDPPNPLEIESPYAVADLPTLAYVQSGDVITLTHPSYPPYELIRVTNTEWTLTAIVFGSSVPAPAGVTAFHITFPGGTNTEQNYVVTAIGLNGEESLASNVATSDDLATATVPSIVTIPLDHLLYPTYKVYRQTGIDGVYGFIGEGITNVSDTTTYFDFAFIPEPALQPPIEKTPFVGEDNYPSISALYQQRQVYANTNNDPDTVWASRTGYFKNFNISAITQDDDAIQFRLVSDEVDAVRQLVNLGDLVVGTEGTLWDIQGDGNGTLTPIAINPRAAAYGGVGGLRPIKSGPRMLYQQALGSAVRELTSTNVNGFNNLAGGDATLFSSHLFDGYTITDWAFQQEPLHVLWVVRSDGIMLGLTYIPEQEMLAWHRHDSLGWIENVCVVPEDKYHWVYLVVRRVIEGEDRRYIERMATTNVTPLFSTPEEAAGSLGGIVTPPPPPPPPPPSTEPIPPPTNGITTDFASTSATFNWTAGSLLAPTEITYNQINTPPAIITEISGGLTSLHVTGLTPGVYYQWLARHHIGDQFSSYLGPIFFLTTAVTLTLDPPPSAPILLSQEHSSGYTDLVIFWTAPTVAFRVSRLQIAGPTDLTPTDGEYVDIGVFATNTAGAIQRVLHAGTYWLRVRYEQQDYTSSDYAGPSDWAITVTDEV